MMFITLYPVYGIEFGLQNKPILASSFIFCNAIIIICIISITALTVFCMVAEGEFRWIVHLVPSFLNLAWW